MAKKAQKFKPGSVFLHDGTVMLRRGQETVPLNPPDALSPETREALRRAPAGQGVEIEYSPSGPDLVKAVRLPAAASVALAPAAAPSAPKTKPPKAPQPAAAQASPHYKPISGGEFENPYNFVAPDSRRRTGELAEGPAVGLDRLHDDRLSGRISVRFTARTPVLIPDVDFEETAAGHKTFRVRKSAGRIVIPPTTIKGPLRSAFEAITSSRFGVMSKAHDDPVGLRLSTGSSSAALVPVRVLERDGKLVAQLLTGADPRPRFQGKLKTLYPASLPTYDITDNAERPEIGPGKGLAHGDRVQVGLERNSLPKVDYWKVVEASKLALDAPAPASTRDGDAITTHGWVCRTNPNTANKHSERVFFCLTEPEVLDVPRSVQDQWSTLIRDYQREHSLPIGKRLRSAELPDTLDNRRLVAARFDFAKIGKTSFSRHVYEPDALALRHGTLCYAELKQLQSGYRIEALYPVMLSRKLARFAPAALAPDLVPASTESELTLAERLFGWVSAKGAIRGRVRIGPVRCDDSFAAFDPAVTIANLSSPKPAQGRFYEALNRYGIPLGAVAKEGFYSDKTHGLRGWKVYPHQQRFDATARNAEWRGRQPTDQNCSIKSWLPAGAAFTVDIHLDDVSRVEAGALLWLLDLGSRGGVLKIGRGKPLGFGSVGPEVTDRTRLCSGAALRRALRQLAEPEAIGDRETLKQEFVDAVGGEESPPLRAFLNAAEGTPNPVRYPRVGDTPEKQYEWFVANEKDKKHSLPPLAAQDRRLPPM